MWLRWVVSNLLHQMAEEKVRHVVDQARHLVEPTLRGKSSTTTEADAQTQLPPPHVALVFALALESGGLVDRMTNVVAMNCPAFLERTGTLGATRLVVAESGVGCAAAEQATEDVIKLHRPQWIVSTGFASALTASLRRGHILMADTILDQRHHGLEVGFRIPATTLSATPGLHVGSLLTVDRLIRDAAEKESLAEEFGAVACDMETAAVARACQRRRVKFLSVRIITDELSDTLPPEVERMLDQQTWAAKLGAATGAVFHRPGSVKDMWRLREAALRSADRLAQFLTGIVPQLTRDAGQ